MPMSRVPFQAEPHDNGGFDIALDIARDTFLDCYLRTIPKRLITSETYWYCFAASLDGNSRFETAVERPFK